MSRVDKLAMLEMLAMAATVGLVPGAVQDTTQSDTDTDTTMKNIQIETIKKYSNFSNKVSDWVECEARL